MAQALIGIGSNRAERSRTLDLAARRLAGLEATSLRAMSEPIETPPEGGVATAAFLNAAARLETGLEPGPLMAALAAIEREAGRAPREARVRWGDRELDLDLLLYDERVLDEPGLRVPHPRMAERRFVLAPAAEVAPEMVHPVLGLTVRAMLGALEGGEDGA